MNSVQQPKPEVSNEMTTGQDQLLAAGSKISFRDIYNQEIDIPLIKGKYYRAEDVDSVFVMINGVLMDVSKHAHRNGKALTLSREETHDAKSKLAEVEKELGVVKKQNESLEAHLNTLISKVSDYSLAASETSINSEDMDKVKSEAEALLQEKHELEREYSELKANYNSSTVSIESLQSEVSDLTNKLQEQQDAYSRLLEDVSNMSTKDTSIEDELENMKALFNQVSDENKDLAKNITDLESENQVLNKTINSAKVAYDKLSKAHNSLVKENEILKQRIDMLKKMNTM